MSINGRLTASPSPAIALSGGTLPRIRALEPSLRPADRKFARIVLSDPAALIHVTVSEAAALAGTGTATVVRCCQELGFRGFHDLKLALATEVVPTGQAVPDDIGPADSPSEIVRKVLTADADAVRDTLWILDTDAFERIVASLHGARRILFVAVGSSAPLAQDAAYRMVTIGAGAEAPADAHVQHVAAGLLTPADVCFAVSHTGSTRETVAAATAARDAGARVVAVTSFARSPLTEVTHEHLVVASRETRFRIEAMASRIAHLSVLDALVVSLALSGRAAAEASLERAGRALSEHRF